VFAATELTRHSQDIDFAGVWDPMIPDAEVISLLSTILTKLEVGEYTIKVCDFEHVAGSVVLI
jgi:histidyl-tRNA synthetase